MLKKINNFCELLKQFGLFSTSKYYWLKKVKKSGLNSIKINGWKHKLFLRFGTSDIDVFHQIIIDKEFEMVSSKVENSVKTIIDAGANIGLSSLFFAQKFPGARIFSIEPEDENFQVMKMNLQNYPNITLLKKALWNTEDTVFIRDRGTGSWGFCMTKDLNNSMGIVIDTITINSIISQYMVDVIDILKIDIEGAEFELFEGEDLSWINKCRYIFVEIHDYIKSGASKSVFKSMLKFDFDFDIMGEYVVFKNNTINE